MFRNQAAIEKQEWIRDATGEMIQAAARGPGGGGYSLANTTRHYDNMAERRARGVGFYAFSQDEDERARQMRELLEMRNQVTGARVFYYRCLQSILLAYSVLITSAFWVICFVDGIVEVKASDVEGQAAGGD